MDLHLELDLERVLTPPEAEALRARSEREGRPMGELAADYIRQGLRRATVQAAIRQARPALPFLPPSSPRPRP